MHKIKLLGLTFFIYAAVMPLGLADPMPIGYGSSDAVLPAKNQELFYMGFEAGYKRYIQANEKKPQIIVDHVTDGSPLGANFSVRRLIGRGAGMIVGFPTSHEALLVSKVTAPAGILSIYAGAGHDDLATYGNMIFSTGESMDYSVEQTFAFIRKQFPGKKGLFVINPKAVFSYNHEKPIRKHMKDPANAPVKIDITYLEQSLQLSDDYIKRLKAGEFGYVFMTQYADESVILLEQFLANGIDIPLISNSSWTTGDVEYIRRLLTKRKSPTYSATLWVQGSPESQEFETYIKKIYGKDPTSEMAYGYDLGVIAAQVVNRDKNLGAKENFVQAFHKNRCFDHLTSGTMCFPEKGGHALRKIYFMQFSKDRYVPIANSNM